MIYPGCERKTLDELDLAYNCAGLSEAQKQIVWLLKSAGFGRLRVSSPSYWFTGLPGFRRTNEFYWHKPGELDMDFIVESEPGSGAEYDPEIMRAFAALSQVWPGGLGIGIRKADPHLHIDARRTNYLRWVEPSKDPLEFVYNTPQYERIWPAYMNAAQKFYRYEGDGGVDWKKFYSLHDGKDLREVLTEYIQTVKAGADWFQDLVKWGAIGAGAYFGLRAIGLIESARGKKR